MGEQSKKEIEQFYMNAYRNHLSEEGVHNYLIEVELRRHKALTEEL